jgi:hypothetical protein
MALKALHLENNNIKGINPLFKHIIYLYQLTLDSRFSTSLFYKAYSYLPKRT